MVEEVEAWQVIWKITDPNTLVWSFALLYVFVLRRAERSLPPHTPITKEPVTEFPFSPKFPTLS